MTLSTGNQFPFAFGAVDNSAYNLVDGFAPAGINNVPVNGAYGNAPFGVPNHGGAYNAPPQNVPMGHPGLTQPMLAGIPTSHHPAAAAQGLPVANGLYNAPMFDGMCSYVVSSSVALANSPTVRDMPEQRPAPLVAPANLANGVAYNALQTPTAAPVPVAPVARPAEIIDLTIEEPAAAPITPAAGTKRARADRTSKGSAKPAKRPRYTAFGPNATPSITPPVVNIPSVSNAPTLSSSASASDAKVLPATPSPSARPRVPRKKPEDPYNLRGAFHYTFVTAAKNGQVESNPRPVYSRPADKVLSDSPSTIKRGGKGKKSKELLKAQEAIEAAAAGSTSETELSPETVAEDGSDAEEDAEFDLDDEVIASAAVIPAAVTPAAATTAAVASVDAPAAEIALEVAAPAEEEHDDGDDLVIDEDDNVVTDAQGEPIKLSVWRAKQAEAAVKQPQDWELPMVPATLITISEAASRDLVAACQKAAASKKSTSSAKRSPAAAKKTVAAAKKTAAPKRRTVSQKKLPSQEPAAVKKTAAPKRRTVSQKKLPSQENRAPSPVSDEDDDELQAQLEAAMAADADESLGAQVEAAFAAESSDDGDDESEDDEDSQPEMVIPRSMIQLPPAAVTQQWAAEAAEDKRTLHDLEAKFGDFNQIRVKRDFETLQEALFDAWNAVGCRSGPLKDQYNAIMIKKGETDYDEWEYSEDES